MAILLALKVLVTVAPESIQLKEGGVTSIFTVESPALVFMVKVFDILPLNLFTSVARVVVLLEDEARLPEVDPKENP